LKNPAIPSFSKVSIMSSKKLGFLVIPYPSSFKFYKFIKMSKSIIKLIQNFTNALLNLIYLDEITLKGLTIKAFITEANTEDFK
jgi:hypothetical protein